MHYSNNFKVTYYECDASVRMKISALVRQMMNAATDHGVILGVGYDVLSERNIAFLLAKNIINITRLPVLNEEITIETSMTSVKGAKFLREIIAVDQEGKICAESLTVWMIINTETRKILRPSTLEGIEKKVGTPIFKEKLQEDRFPKEITGEPVVSSEIKAVYSYIDSNNHVNNSYYFDFICDTIPYNEIVEKGIKSIQLSYINEVLPESKILLNGYQMDDGKYYFLSKDNNHSFFEALVEMNN